jgi:hypothetical protein
MFGWIFNISVISLLIILIFHYAFDLFENKSDNLVDLKVQKYKNIIDAMVQREKRACEEKPEDNGLEELELYVKELSE